MPVHTPEVRERIASEMEDCFREPTAFIHTDPAWRLNAIQRWEQIGGDATVYEKLFEQADQNQAGA